MANASPAERAGSPGAGGAPPEASRAALQFHLLSFEGPDPYSRAGGIASRITGLSETLAELGFETHLWFVGDPDRDGNERHGRLHLHRWCQWISRHHPNGVYDGEDGKSADYAASLPGHLLESVLLPHLRQGGEGIVLAEEWQTAAAVARLDEALRAAGAREHATLLWNANNTFGFERIDWPRLAQAAVLTTVSRYMRQRMRGLGVDPLVIPNGLSADAFAPPSPAGSEAFRRHLNGRLALVKIARWDPDKRWLLAIDIVRALKQLDLRPLLIARGGMEAHGAEVRQAMAAAGLRVLEREARLEALADLDQADVVTLRSHVDTESRRVLLAESQAVLANSEHEPFGLVGLETMAAGGVACTGCSGEDYAIPGRNALVLQTADPRELVGMLQRLRARPAEERELRRQARLTARHYAWSEVVRRSLLPRVELLRGDGAAPPPGAIAR